MRLRRVSSVNERKLAAQRMRERGGNRDVDELPLKMLPAHKINNPVVFGAAGELSRVFPRRALDQHPLDSSDHIFTDLL